MAVAERFFKRFLERLALRYGLDVLRGYILKRLENVTLEQLYQAIRDGENVLLPEEDVRFGRKWIRKLSKYVDYVNVETVLMWLSQDRPELATLIINSEGGVKWLAEQVERVKSQLLHK